MIKIRGHPERPSSDDESGDTATATYVEWEDRDGRCSLWVECRMESHCVGRLSGPGAEHWAVVEPLKSGVKVCEQYQYMLPWGAHMYVDK